MEESFQLVRSKDELDHFQIKLLFNLYLQNFVKALLYLKRWC